MATVKIDNGRPKGGKTGGEGLYKNFEAVCRRNSERALIVVLDILGNEEADPKLRLQAADTIMNRAWGKPKQQVEATVEHKIEGIADALATVVSRIKKEEERARGE